MINPSELRIGNWLLKNEEEPVKVIGVTNASVDVWECLSPEFRYGEKDEPERGTLALNLLSPIPIGPVWLQRCGLKDPMGNRLAYRMNISTGDELCWYMQDGFLRYQTRGSGFTRQLHHIKFVHQLQNWYFTFTGNELQIMTA